jgi:hypothetical protein
MFFDLSASMGARSDAGKNRIERAKLQAKRLLDSLSRYDRVTISTVPAQTEGVSQNQMTPDEAWQTIEGINATALSAETESQVKQIAGEAGGEGAALFVFTDKLPTRPQPGIQYVCCGGPSDNCAITRFSVRKMSGDSALYEAFILVRNFGMRELRTVARLTDNSGRVLASNPVSLSAGSEQALFFTFPLQTANGEILKVQVDSRDQMEIDNYAFATLLPRRDIHVALLGREDQNIIRALSQYPGIQITRLERLDDSERFDLVILNEYSPTVFPPTNYLVIAPPKEIPGVLALGGEIDVKSRDPISTGGLFTDVSVMRDIAVAKAKRVIFADSRNFETLLVAQTDEGIVPLIGVLRRGKGAVVYVGFALSQSDWQKQVSFPLFFALLLETVSGQATGQEFVTLRTGDVIPIRAKDVTQIRAPSGKTLTPGKESGQFYPLQLTEAGVYEIRRANAVDYVGASLLSEEESDTSGDLVDFDPSVLRQTEKREERVTHLYQYFLLLAGLLMIADWMTSKGRRTA